MSLMSCSVSEILTEAGSVCPAQFPYKKKDTACTGHRIYKFIMTLCFVFNDEIQPAGYSDLIKE